MPFFKKKHLYDTINTLFVISAISSTFSASATSLTTRYNNSIGYTLASILTFSDLVKVWGFDITRKVSEESSDENSHLEEETPLLASSANRSKLYSSRFVFFIAFTTILITSSFKQWVDILFLWQATKAWINTLEDKDTPPVVSLSLIGNILTILMLIIPLSFYYATSQVEIYRKLSNWLSPRSDVVYYSLMKKMIKPLAKSLTFRFIFRTVGSFFDTFKQILSLIILLPPTLMTKWFSQKETAAPLGIVLTLLLLFLGSATYSQVFFVEGNAIRKNFEGLVNDREPRDYKYLKKLPVAMLKLTTLFLFLTPLVVGLSMAMPIVKYVEFIGLSSHMGYLLALAPAIFITIQQNVVEASIARMSVHGIIKSKLGAVTGRSRDDTVQLLKPHALPEGLQANP